VDAGCAHKLADVVDPIDFKGMRYVMESGATGGHVYRTKHPLSRTGHAVVKVFCMPFGSKDKHGAISKRPGCVRHDIQVCCFSLLGNVRPLNTRSIWPSATGLLFLCPWDVWTKRRALGVVEMQHPVLSNVARKMSKFFYIKQS
jgi:hypothetical protein